MMEKRNFVTPTRTSGTDAMEDAISGAASLFGGKKSEKVAENGKNTDFADKFSKIDAESDKIR